MRPHRKIPKIANVFSQMGIVEEQGMGRSGIAKQIRQLQLIGRIKCIGPDKGGHWEVVEEDTI